MGRKFSCVLCKRSEETKVTRMLLTKDEVTAHLNCLLFSSGIFCRDPPESSDLYGFSVEDVTKEVARGKRLVCNFCNKRGATAGCEVRRCKKSYHYPCAVEEGAKALEDEDRGKYEIYCLPHYQEKIGGYENQSSPSSTEAGPSKGDCLVCEKKEESISVDSLSSVIMVYCKKHAPSSQKRTNGDDAVAGPSTSNSDSNSTSSSSRRSAKRRLSLGHKQEETPSKRKSEKWNLIVSGDSTDADDNEPNIDMETFAPIDHDLEDSENSAPQQQSNVLESPRKVAGSPAAPPSGDHRVDGNGAENKDGGATFGPSLECCDVMLWSSTDEESESLLPPVKAPVASHWPGLRITEQSSQTTQSKFNSIKSELQAPTENKEGCSPAHPGRPTSPRHSDDQPQACSVAVPHLGTTSALSPPPDPIGPSSPASPPSTSARPSNPERDIDSSGFWRSCNAAGCTQAIFTEFINEMNDVAARIQSDQASQDDYDLALSVTAASGKLPAFVAKQQEALQRKLIEIEKAMTAMTEVASALKKRP